ncbi:hypothetical protein PN4B1_17160 [Paenibacillus naphthalenovorans]|nr:hypothetical protein PN4B1_17160 [Paenibacillus naphthalenovorans]
MQNPHKEIEITVINLCKWINDRLNNGASGDEIKILPEVINATAKLAERF